MRASRSTFMRVSTRLSLVVAVVLVTPAFAGSDAPRGIDDELSCASLPPRPPRPPSSPDDPVELTWRSLAGLDHRTGEMSDQLRDVMGKPVRIPGFTVPLEDFASSATEFLLVPYVGACVHTPPPPPNQLVSVQMDRGKRAKMDGWNPVWLEGVLHIEEVNSIYGSAGFRVVGTAVTPYQ